MPAEPSAVAAQSEPIREGVRGTQLLTRALRLLSRLRESDEVVETAALAGALGTPRSNVYRLVLALELAGMIRRTESGLQLGLRFLDFGAAVQSRLDVVGAPAAIPIMRRVSEAVGETTLVTMPAGMYAMAVFTVDGPQAVRLSYTPGRLLPYIRGASGKVMLPWLAASVRERVLKEADIARPDRSLDAGLRAEIDAIRAQGVCVTHGEVDPGVVAVAAPILRPGGQLIGGFTVAGPAERVPASRESSFGEVVRSAADELAVALADV